MKTKRYGDCLSYLPKIHNINLIITDPPYNIGWKYSNKVNDNKKDYHSWCLQWAELCFDSLKDQGVLCIINYPENNNILYTRLIEKGYNFIQQLIWNYNTMIGHSKKKYTRSYRTLLIFSKGKEYTFNPTKQPYKNPNDPRIKERIRLGNNGCTHYDVFNINLCKNVSKSKKNIGINQLPNDLVDMLIKTFSNKGDLILDPFSGNDTVLHRAEALGRDSVGIDINDYTLIPDSRKNESDFSKTFAKNYEKNQKEFEESTKDLRDIPEVRKHLPINSQSQDSTEVKNGK